jgi:EAL domain-containing protein (putative c-di-GMP-specific phosphodiesterase class I)
VASFLTATALVLSGWFLTAALVCAVPILVLMVSMVRGHTALSPMVFLVVAAMVFAAVSQVLFTAQGTELTTPGATWGFVLFSSAFTTCSLLVVLVTYLSVRDRLRANAGTRLATRLGLVGFGGTCAAVQWTNVLYVVDGVGRNTALIVIMTISTALTATAALVARSCIHERLPRSFELLFSAMLCANIGGLFGMIDTTVGPMATLGFLFYVAGYHLAFIGLVHPSASALAAGQTHLITATPSSAAMAATPVLNLGVAWLVLDGYRSRYAVTVASVGLSCAICVGVWLIARERSRRTVLAIVDDADWQILKAALEADELSLYHQPILRLSDRRVVGTEALVRWQRGGVLLAGASVIEFARNAGAIEQLERWVMKRAVRDGAQVLALLDVDRPYVSFNVSPEQFVRPGLTKHLVDLCTAAGCEPSGFMIELTETSTIADWDVARLTVTDLQDAGFTVAVDDFGAGHANLLQLQHLDVDLVKLDRDIVVAATTSARGRSIAASAASLVTELGLRSVAEGIEDLRDLEAVEALGCQFAQGYAIGRPMPLRDLSRYLLSGIDHLSMN